MSRTIVPMVAATLLLVRMAAAEDVGWVATLDGTAERQRAGAWTAAAQGDGLQLADHVRTPAGSRIKLLFRDDSVLTLSEQGELVIDEQVAGTKPTSKFSLFGGKLRAIVTEQPGATGTTFEVATPTAIAGVRGTSFIAAYDPAKDETQVVGLERTTAVWGTADPKGAKVVLLGPGESTTVGRGAVPNKPFKLPEAAIRSLTAETTAKAAGDATQADKPPADPRVPRSPGDRNGSLEGRVIDQPIDVIQQQPVRPPPPPIR